MSKHEDLTSRRYGRLVVIAPAESANGHRRWLCRCDCTQETIVSTYMLTTGKTKSCGCWARDLANERRRLLTDARKKRKSAVPGQPRSRPPMPSPAFWAWRAIVASFNVPATPDDRIAVDQNWVEEGGAGYDAFAADVGVRPLGTSLVRIDPTKPYTKANCSWQPKEIAHA
jgi:hypothetical protein